MWRRNFRPAVRWCVFRRSRAASLCWSRALPAAEPPPLAVRPQMKAAQGRRPFFNSKPAFSDALSVVSVRAPPCCTVCLSVAWERSRRVPWPLASAGHMQSLAAYHDLVAGDEFAGHEMVAVSPELAACGCSCVLRMVSTHGASRVCTHGTFVCVYGRGWGQHRNTPFNNEDTLWDFTPENYLEIENILKKYPPNYKRSGRFP
jgi:hypothetical protein